MKMLFRTKVKTAASAMVAAAAVGSLAAAPGASKGRKPGYTPLCFRHTFDAGLQADLAGGNRVPVKSDNATLVPGRAGQGVSLPPGSSLVYEGGHNLGLVEGAVSLWIKPNWPFGGGIHGRDERVIFRIYADKDNLFYLRYRGGHELLQLYWRVQGKHGGKQERAKRNGFDWQEGKWNHVLISWKTESTGKIEAKVFVNNMLALAAPDLAPLREDLAYAITLGSADAVIDDLAIYKKWLALPSYQIVALAKHATASIHNDGPSPFATVTMGSDANDLRELPTGEQIFGGIPFEIVDPAANAGRSLVMLHGKQNPNMPRQIEIPIHAKFRTAYFLGASANTVRAVNLVIDVRYEDGSFESIPLHGREELCEWWRPRGSDSAFVAWEGKNPIQDRVGLCCFEWENRRPHSKVDYLKLSDSGNSTTPWIAAITLTTQRPQFARLKGRGAPVEEKILLVQGKQKEPAIGLAKLKIPHDTVDAANWHEKLLHTYDVLVFGCWAHAKCPTDAVVEKLKAFVAAGGSLLILDRGLFYRWEKTPLAYSGTRHYIVDRIVEQDHPIFNRPNPVTLGDLENIFRGRIYDPLLKLGPGWRPLVRGRYLFMNPAARGEHEPVGLATGKLGKGTVTYCCMVASQDWIIGDRGSWGSNGGKLFENLVEWAIHCARQAKGKPEQKINRQCEKPATAPEGWIPYALPRSVEPHFPIDLSYTLDKPAGKHGFVKVGKDGSFVFEDGSPARFWGFQLREPGKESIPQYLDRCAKMGINCLRYHIRRQSGGRRIKEAIRRDGWGRFTPSDVFFAEARKRGIYFYIGLDHHAYISENTKGDYAARQAATPKGVIFIDEEIQELHRQRIRTFLEQRNSLTGRRYIDEPALAFVELYNENSLTTHMWGNVLRWPEPYRGKIKGMWNRWLLTHYESRAGLTQAWTTCDGKCALHGDEDPANGTVAMPDLHKGIKLAGTGWDREFAIDDKTMSAIRLNDMARFICEVETSFYTSMRAFLRTLGFKQPIFGTGYSFCPSGLKSQGVFDTIGIGSGPSGSAVFVGPEHENMGGINEYMSYLAAHRLAGHALVNREWYASYPDRYRTLGIVQTFVYGAFQGMASISLHAPGDPRRAIQTGLPGGGATDPARAAVMAVMGLMHRRGDIREGKHTAEIALSPTDTFYVANTARRGRRVSAYRFLPYIHRVQNRFIERDGYQGDADVVVTSGLSSDVNLKGAPRVFVSLDNPYQDLHNKRKGRHLPAAMLVPGLNFRDIRDTKLTFSGIGLQNDVVPVDLLPGIEVSSIAEGGVPFGLTPDKEYCLGYTDDRGVIAPYCGHLERRFKGDVPLSYRLYLDAARKWGLIHYGPEAIEKGVIATDTGEISKWYKKRYMTYSAPRIQGGSGYIGGHKLSLDDVWIEAKTSFANIIVISLTMQPIKASDRILVLAIGHAGNTGDRYALPDAVQYDPVNEVNPERLHRRSMISEGRLPVVIEPIEADIQVRCAKTRTIYPLGETGDRGKPVEFARGNGTTRFAIGAKHRTIFYEILCEH